MPAPAQLVEPPVQLRELLERARERDEPFDIAWRRVMDGRRAPGRIVWPHATDRRRRWRMILTAQRHHWRSAYNRESPTALAQLPHVLELLSPDHSSPESTGGEARMARAPLDYIVTPQVRVEQRARAAA